MRKTLSTPTLLLLTLLIACSVRQAYAYDQSAFFGTVICTGSTLVNGQPAATGTATLTGDGSGNWTSGSASYQITSAQAQGNCNYTLDHGRYAVNSDGTGTSATHWTLVAASSSTACKDIAFGSDNLWMPTLTYWGSRDGAYSYGSCTLSQAQ